MPTGGDYEAPPRQQEHRTAVTNGSGNAVVTWPAGVFAAAPVVTIAVQAGAGFYSARVAANSATSTTVHVVQAAGVTLLGIGVLAAGVAASGVTVHVTATAP